ncbi:MAG: cupin domain-containing protein [Anaerolineae bacterium]|nr:cupin domain-containing protein [Anaerolineae bacterium]
MNTDPVQLKDKYDNLAPDGSEIYLLASGSKGGLCQCVLPVGATSQAVSHKTIEELWYFVAGQGEVYRQGLNNDQPTVVTPGTSLVIPVHTTFQFRNTGDVPLKFIIATMPPWPGASEANAEVGIW